MKLTTIVTDGQTVPAALLTSGKFANLAAASRAGLLGNEPVRELADILDLDGPLLAATRDLVSAVEEGSGDAFDKLSAAGGIVAAEDAKYAPMLRPSLIFSCGMAYREHMAEMNTPIPKKPAGFVKAASAIQANNGPIVLPPHDPDMVDYECELACVIGRRLYNASPDEVLSHIVGFTMMNDVGSRSNVAEWLASMEGDSPRPAVGLFMATVADKQFPTFCPLGPVIETADTFGDPMDFSVQTKLNGEVVQSAHSSDLIFSIAESLSFFSRWHEFRPGDVYSTGSPSGVGYARNPQRMLRAGDVVEVSCPKIGVLRNPVVAG